MEDLRGVLVGCGAISRIWLDAIRETPGVRLVGLVDLDLTRAQSAAERAGIEVPAGVSLEAILTDVEAELVFDCTPPGSREAIASSATAHGCHVFAEKPLALTQAAASSIVSTAQKAHVYYAVMRNHRYHNGSRRVHRILNSGVIGRLTACNSIFAAGVRFDGFRAAMRNVLLRDMASHTFDLAGLLIGRHPHSVICHEWNPAESWAEHGGAAAAIFEFEGGVVYTFRGSWCVPGLRTAWTSDWRFDGTTASLAWDGEEAIVIDPPPEPEAVAPVLRDTEGHAGAIAAFVEAIRSNTPPETVAAKNRHSLLMVLAAIESAKTGRKVTIPE